MNKVFGIGLSHTATKSLNAALEMLGIPSIHWPVDRTTYRELSSGNYRLTILEKYQAITDITVTPFYAQIDKAYPGSKFILTVRDKDKWLASMSKINDTWKRYTRKNVIAKYLTRFSDDWPAYKLGAFRSVWFYIKSDKAIEFFRQKTYGGIVFDDIDLLAQAYDYHHKNVLEYFKNRRQDLLVLDITKGEGWGKLCPFLNKPVPADPFPNIFDKRRHMVTVTKIDK